MLSNLNRNINFNFKMAGADDLERFINGEIGFEEMQGFIHEDVPIEESIRLAL